jgi:hypothetical protein
MTFFSRQITVPAPSARSLAIAALLGVTMLTSPPATARADTARRAPIPSPMRHSSWRRQLRRRPRPAPGLPLRKGKPSSNASPPFTPR